MDDLTQSASPASPLFSKPRIPYACEACRVAKVKCQPNNTTGVCRRCSMSKRECIFKTGPRTRRRRSKFHPAATRTTPPPSAPSKTFTIDVPMPADDDADGEAADGFDFLQEAHEGFIDSLVSGDEDGSHGDGGSSGLTGHHPPSSTHGGAFSVSTPSSSSRSVHGFSSIRPQFNLDSATSLLESFMKDMLPYFPVIVLPPETSVPVLAKEKPFILLAILASASGIKSLQGHSLYDEEFRKVLGLKFVSGGERSVELLIGLLIYCAWYPFHLRPKNRQAMQYNRMACDIVHDLDLDQAPDDIDLLELRADEERMAGIRAYIACYYLCSSFASTWHKKHSVPFQQWTTICCDALDRPSDDPGARGDRILAWLARLGHLLEEMIAIANQPRRMQQSEEHVQLMIRGMDAQFREWQSRMASDVSVSPALQMTNYFTEIVLCSYPLLKFRASTSQKRNQPCPEASADPVKLLQCVSHLRTWYDYLMSLPASEFAHFVGVHWGYFVITVILGLKLSFPMHQDCPFWWDHAAARTTLEFGSFLDKFCNLGGTVTTQRLTPASDRRHTGTDVLTASKVVVNIVRRKYEKRLAALERETASIQVPQPMAPPGVDKSLHGCPMFDGSLDPYIQAWDDSFLDTANFTNPTMPISGTTGGETPLMEQPMVFHDLWATMTMGWGQE